VKKQFIKLISFFFLLSPLLAHSKTWVFFDLGDTIIDTSKKHYRYLPGAWDYINDLKAKGYSIGIISNIPESFGNGQLEKLGTLKSYIKKKWNDQIPMDWKQFDKIILPPSDAKKKPHPHMFLEAKKLNSNCLVFFQGENQIEVKTAEKLGMKSFQVGQSNNFYLLIESIEKHYYKSLNSGNCQNN
jgi:FMN phosphatase YigB (HAD superfamily)